MGAYFSKVDPEENTLYLRAGDVKIRADCKKLSAASPYFKKVLPEYNSNLVRRVFGLKDVEPNDFARIIDYLNGNRNIIGVDNVMNMMLVAAKYQFESVVRDCEIFVVDNFEEFEVRDVLETAIICSNSAIKALVRQKFLKDLVKQKITFSELIVSTYEWSPEAQILVSQTISQHQKNLLEMRQRIPSSKICD